MTRRESRAVRRAACLVLLILNVACARLSASQDPVQQRLAATTEAVTSAPEAVDGAPVGYCQFPAISGERIVFCAEGDLWSVSAEGSVAQRLTTHKAEESHPSISPDGQWIAYTAQYEGPAEVYVMPAAGGKPRRLTFDGMRNFVCGWSRDGRVLYRTTVHSTLPNYQLALVHPQSLEVSLVPLAQGAQGVFDNEGETLFFTRLNFQGSHTKRYKGGTAQNLWRFSTRGDQEATPLTADYDGTSRDPMWVGGRLYFASDRDDTVNLWSMKPDGSDLKQHTHHVGWDVKEPESDGTRIVYQLGADLRLFDTRDGSDRALTIGLASDFDQQRERWQTSPMDYLTAAHVSPEGDRVALTARGEVFVAPVGPGRLINVTRDKTTRYRDARFLPGGEKILALSDRTGEVEFWTYPANGIGDGQQLTSGGEILRWEGVPSPDGKYIAHHDKKQRLWLFEIESGEDRIIDEISESSWDQFGDLTWSPDSLFLAYTSLAPNTFRQVCIYDLATQQVHAVTTDRYDSYAPAWSGDGKWLYFLSDRTFRSWTGSPWGPRLPQPYFPDTTKIYYLALGLDQRSPFLPDDELIREKKKQEEKEKKEEEDEEEEENGEKAEGDDDEREAEQADAEEQPPRDADKPEDAQDEPDGKKTEPTVKITWDGLRERLHEAPVDAGNYSGLFLAGDRLFWMSRDSGPGDATKVQTLSISSKPGNKVETFAEGVSLAELSSDGKKILLRKGSALHVVEVGASASLKPENAVNTAGWALNFDPKIEWRQMFVEAWRLERDYFYDPDMHGVDWDAMLAKYLPLVDRVTTRGELSDLISQMVAELSALHIFVSGGDHRRGDDNIGIATLGARIARDEAAGGWRIEHIYRTDPDEPAARSPLADPTVNAAVGDLIIMVDGVTLDGETHLSALLRHKAGRQVRLRLRRGQGEDAGERDVIVTPISAAAERNMRYDEWEYTRRLAVEEKGEGRLGYVHLRAMGGGDISQWTRDFFPVFDREGLIIDVRHNGGGNIDSWILGQLLRRAWMYWHGRFGEPAWNMQYAFRGHLVVLCDQNTGSDGEAFCDGFRRLGLGKVIGTRTWGGEIWLSSSNVLVDGGIATAAEYGVYGPEGEWLIEGRGFDPDIVVDNLPHAAFKGEDAQLDAAIAHLLERIANEPVDVPPPPAKPVKASADNRRP